MKTLLLTEEDDLALQEEGLEEHIARALQRDKRFELKQEFAGVGEGRRYVLRSKGWVGHIPVGREVWVHVRPKLPVLRIFELLEFAYDLKSFNILQGAAGVDTVDGLLDRIVSILSERVLERAQKGLYRAYRSEHDDLPFVRGRIDVRESIRRGPRGATHLHCDFEELTSDVEDNRLLLWTLRRVSRVGSRRDTVRKQVERACRVLSGMVTLEEKSTSDYVDRWYSRLNDDYRPMHGLCRLILDHLTPDIPPGDNPSPPFLLNMPKLFEKFVAQYLKTNSPRYWLFKEQFSVKRTYNSDELFKIDLVLYDQATGGPIAVLDTKYKTSGIPSAEDIKDVVAYAAKMDVERAFLIYPSARSQPYHEQFPRVRVDSVICNMALGAEAAGRAFLDDLFRAFSIPTEGRLLAVSDAGGGVRAEQ